MINIDTRILEPEFGLNESQMWLLLQISKRIGKKMFCWPSNETLMKDTGWKIDKLRLVKQSLVEIGVIRVRVKPGLSNEYEINTDLIAIYVPAKVLSTPLEKPTGGVGKNQQGTPLEKPTPKYYPSEVLESNSNSLPKGNVTKQPELEIIKEKTVREKCIAIWAEAYPDLMASFDGLQGKKMNSLIKKITNVCKASGLEGDNSVLASFEKLVKSLPEWYKGKDLSIIDSKFGSIIHEIKHGRKKEDFHSQNSANRVFSKYSQ